MSKNVVANPKHSSKELKINSSKPMNLKLLCDRFRSTASSKNQPLSSVIFDFVFSQVAKQNYSSVQNLLDLISTSPELKLYFGKGDSVMVPVREKALLLTSSGFVKGETTKLLRLKAIISASTFLTNFLLNLCNSKKIMRN